MKKEFDSEILDRISRHCPEAFSTYLTCINRHEEAKPIVFTRKMIEEELSETVCLFKNRLKLLAKENLLEWFSDGNNVTVTLADNEV